MSIRQLPEDVVHKLKSSVVITSLNNVVCELLKNALDAGSTKVNVYIDYSRGNCTVEDNGQGISPSEFKEDGGLGKLHHTSKYPPTSKAHGSHGDFLASLATLSLLSLVSRHRNSLHSHALLIHGGKVLARHCPCPPEQALHTFQHGTRVAVRDLFGSMPVRVKHRATLSSEKSYLDKEWTRLLHDVVAILMPWPSDVTVLLSDSLQQREVRLRSQESTDIVTRASRLLVQASFADASTIEGWVPVSVSSQQIKVKGCIYLRPVATRHCQFISLGIHPILDEHGTNVLYEQVNKIFTHSAFSTSDELDYDGSTNGSSKENPRNQSKLRRSIERWPMFCFKIYQSAFMPQNIDLILDDRQSHLAEIIDLLKTVCYGFLKKHQMQPRKVDLKPSASVFSMSGKYGRSKVSNQRSSSMPLEVRTKRSAHGSRGQAIESRRSESPFSDWHRIKSGHATRSLTTNPIKSSSPTSVHNPPQPLIGQGGKLLRKPFQNLDHETAAEDMSEIVVANSSDVRLHPTERLKEVRGDVQQPRRETQDPLASRELTSSRVKPPPSEWLQGVLQEWKNPVFEVAEAPVPQAYDECRGDQQDTRGEGVSRWFTHGADGKAMLESASLGLQGRVSRSALSQAEVISQVDRKFILLRMPVTHSLENMQGAQPVLVMVDQHAADERCQLEAIMAEYFVNDASGELKAAIESLDRPRLFEVSLREGALFKQHQQFFKTWGIIYFVQDQSGSNTNACMIQVTALPPSIIERCRTEPRLLIELLRKEIWRLNDEGQALGPPNPTAPSGSRSLTSHFRKCPRGILELLHSRSCRSAIMFNDILSQHECEDLIRRLAECTFPFQCAHGRPSMAPLIGLGSGSRIGGWDGDSGRVSAARWKTFLGG